MTPALWGAVLGTTAALGALLAWSRVSVIRRPQLALRVLPYVRDLTQTTAQATAGSGPAARGTAVSSVFGPVLRSAADGVERVLGGAHSVRRRLERAGLDLSVHEFRIQQVQ